MESPREDEPGENSFGSFWGEKYGESSKEMDWDHRVYNDPEFWDCNSDGEFGDCVAVHSRGQVHKAFESVDVDSFETEHVENPRPLLAVKHHCPTGCPRSSNLHAQCLLKRIFFTGERVTKAFFLNPADDGPGFLVSDRWDNPVAGSEAKWTGYTFLTMRNEALEGFNIQLEPAATADGPPWPAAPPAKDDMDGMCMWASTAT